MLPMVITMMVLSPISGTMTAKMGPRRLISFGMIATGAGMMLLLILDVGSPYWKVLPGFIMMGFGMSFIWAPMTTAVLNSVDPEKSGIASAVNGAIREIGTAFGIALLGTIANRAYISAYKDDSSIQAIKADSSLASIHPIVDKIGEGVSYAGYAAISQLPADVASQFSDTWNTVRLASSEAFMSGMDLALIVGGVGIVISALISYVLISDAVVLGTATAPETEKGFEGAVLPEASIAD